MRICRGFGLSEGHYIGWDLGALMRGGDWGGKVRFKRASNNATSRSG